MKEENNKNQILGEKLAALIERGVVNYLNQVAAVNLKTGEKNEAISINNISRPILEKRKKYLQIALNNNLIESRDIIRQLPASDKIIIEVGTPLLKIYGLSALEEIRSLRPNSYLVADAKIADLAEREVEMLAEAGANAITCLGVAPTETIDEFVGACSRQRVDSMIDMMNIDNPVSMLKKLKKLPTVVILHRGVDETEFSKEKTIPYYQIKQIKGNYNLIVAVAGGDTPLEIQSAFFNDADIVVVWKNFMQADASVGELAKSFLQEIR